MDNPLLALAGPSPALSRRAIAALEEARLPVLAFARPRTPKENPVIVLRLDKKELQVVAAGAERPGTLTANLLSLDEDAAREFVAVMASAEDYYRRMRKPSLSRVACALKDAVVLRMDDEVDMVALHRRGATRLKFVDE